MEYKYPKKVTVGSEVFNIIYDYKNDDGASFSFPKDGKPAYVKFGMKCHKVSPLFFLDCVIHEFKEIIQMEQGSQAFFPARSHYEFHYSHGEHTDLCSRLAQVVSLFIK